MKPETERKLVGYDCLAVLVGICIFLCLSILLHWAYSLGVAVFIGLGWLHVWLSDRRDHHRHVEILKLAFSQTDVPIPKFTEANSYGFKHFTLTFSSEAELKQAESEGCITAFKQEIQALYWNTGSKNNPFNVEQAVWCNYVGWQFPPDAFDCGNLNDLP
jgi:uncharacterized membrane protein